MSDTIILVVEDLKVEQERAKEELRSLGFKPAVAGTLYGARRIWESLGEKIQGIITDLHFPEGFDGEVLNAEKPCGLSVVAYAVGYGLPVVVCSDIDHHQSWYVRKITDALADHPAYARISDVPVMMDKKNWTLAGEELQRMINKSKEVLQ